jgi:hypothetical protein
MLKNVYMLKITLLFYAYLVSRNSIRMGRYYCCRLWLTFLPGRGKDFSHPCGQTGVTMSGKSWTRYSGQCRRKELNGFTSSPFMFM